MRRYKPVSGEERVGSTKKIGKYLIVRGMDMDSMDKARFGILLERGQQRLYRSGLLSPTQAKKVYDSIRTIRNVEDYLGGH